MELNAEARLLREGEAVMDGVVNLTAERVIRSNTKPDSEARELARSLCCGAQPQDAQTFSIVAMLANIVTTGKSHAEIEE